MADLTTSQRKAIEALLSSPSIRRAALTAHLGERTLYRYLSNDQFRAELRRRQDAVLSQVTSALVGLSGEAVEALHDVLNDAEASDSVRVRAALGWLKEKRETVELQDLVERVSALEAWTSEQSQKPTG